MSVAVPVPPTIRISQTIKADGSVFVRVSVIVGLAACPVPATAEAAAVDPHPPLRANSPLVQPIPAPMKDGAVIIPENLFVTEVSCPMICQLLPPEGGFRNAVPNVEPA